MATDGLGQQGAQRPEKLGRAAGASQHPWPAREQYLPNWLPAPEGGLHSARWPHTHKLDFKKERRKKKKKKKVHKMQMQFPGQLFISGNFLLRCWIHDQKRADVYF